MSREQVSLEAAGAERHEPTLELLIGAIDDRTLAAVAIVEAFNDSESLQGLRAVALGYDPVAGRRERLAARQQLVAASTGTMFRRAAAIEDHNMFTY